MAFISSIPTSLRTTAFSGNAIHVSCPPRPATATAFRMTASENNSKPVGKAGDSLWKENAFTGGFPGGESFMKGWIEDGLKEDVPDMPDDMQAKASFSPKAVERNTLLSKLDKLEFFGDKFSSDEESVAQPAGESDDPSGTPAPVVADSPSDSDAPNEALYEQYYPAAIRNIAPEINITYEKNVLKDRVSLAMTEVIASPAEVHFPKEMKNKAPIIELFYDGSSVATASISVRMADIEGLPTLQPPAKVGDTVTSLVPGAGGGLKLDFAVEGTGPVNVYSDPRCVEKYNAMIGK